MPTVFYGRDDWVADAARLLVSNSRHAHLAILGSGGMGKTSVALAVLYNADVVACYPDGRLFLSCEALVDANDIVVSLTKLLGLPASRDLLSEVITRLKSGPRVVLVLDNLDAVWLSSGTLAHDVDELLGRLAQIPSVSLVITCRGTELPQSVQWANAGAAILEAFSPEAALQTFVDKVGRQLTYEETNIAKQLVAAVDRMPLAVSLLGQLACRGNLVSELLVRWNRERTSLLRTHGTGRINSVEVSIQLSINMLLVADDTRESLQLLSLCSMLPDGLRRDVFEMLRRHFKQIDRARDTLLVYALISLGADRTLRTLSPVRHLVLDRHPPEPRHRNALLSIYFGIAGELPVDPSKTFTEAADIAAPEIGNLSSLLLIVVDQPSQQVVDAVHRFTSFAYWQQPTVTVALALLPHLDTHPEWKATCLKSIGLTQIRLDHYRSAIESLRTASRLFCEIGNRSEAAWCNRMAAEPHHHLSEYDEAESLLNDALEVYGQMGDAIGQAMCRLSLGDVMKMKNDFPAAIEHLSTARQTFNILNRTFEGSQCSQFLGIVYLNQGNLDSAATELEAARLAFSSLGNKIHMAHSTGFLSAVYRRQGRLLLAEQALEEAERIHKDNGDRLGLVSCAEEFGYLRNDQRRRDEAIAYFKSATRLYEELDMLWKAEHCRKWIMSLGALSA